MSCHQVPDDNGSVYYSANEVHKSLKNLNAKTTISIIDACNNYEFISPKEISIFAKHYEGEKVRNLTIDQITNYKSFFSVKGDIIIASSEPGKKSIATSSGSCFTNSLIKSLKYYINNNAEYINWTNLLNKVHVDTYNESLRLANDNRPRNVDPNYAYSGYYPIWVNNLALTIAGKRFVRELLPSSIKLTYSATELTRRERRQIGSEYTHHLQYWISGTETDLDKIDKVIYYLHKSFEDPIHENADRADYFSESYNVWGQFTLRARIIMKNGSEFELSKFTQFPPP